MFCNIYLNATTPNIKKTTQKRGRYLSHLLVPSLVYVYYCKCKYVCCAVTL